MYPNPELTAVSVCLKHFQMLFDVYAASSFSIRFVCGDRWTDAVTRYKLIYLATVNIAPVCSQTTARMTNIIDPLWT